MLREAQRDEGNNDSRHCPASLYSTLIPSRYNSSNSFVGQCGKGTNLFCNEERLQSIDKHPNPESTIVMNMNEEGTVFRTMPQEDHSVSPDIYNYNAVPSLNHHQNLHKSPLISNQISRNVTFSPVVSKLRYAPAILEPNIDSYSIPKCIRDCDKKSPFQFDLINESDDNFSSAVHKVKVHVQEIDQHKVQRVQVSVPQSNGIVTERYSFNFTYPSPSNNTQCNVKDVTETEPISTSKSNNSKYTLPEQLTCEEFRDEYANYNDLMCFNQRYNATAELCQGEKIPYVKYKNEEASDKNSYVNQQFSAPTGLNFVSSGTDDFVHGLVFSAFDAKIATGERGTDVKPSSSFNGNTDDSCIMGAPVETNDARDMPMKINHLPTPVRNEMISCGNNVVEELLVEADKAKNAGVYFGNVFNSSEITPSQSQHQHRNINRIGSLECIEPEDQEQVVGENKGKRDSKSKAETDYKGNSWPNALKKFKEKSKPKLSFLHKITFGRFRNSSSGKEDSRCTKKSQKRSSCPPLGHPLLQNISANERRSSGGNVFEHDDGCIDSHSRYFNDLSNIFENSTRIDQGLTTDDSKNDNGTVLGKPLEELNGSILSGPEIATDNENKIRTPVNFTNVTKELPPKPSPRKKHLQLPKLSPQFKEPNNASIGEQIDSRRISSNTVGETKPADPDEFSVKFEEIMEGIWGVEPEGEDSIIMEEKGIMDDQLLKRSERETRETFKMMCSYKQSNTGSKSLSLAGGGEIIYDDKDESGRTSREDESDQMLESCRNSIVSRLSGSHPDEACNSVVGKPPKPPITARQIGMQTRASERFSYLRGRMNATATTETRLAMELAAKLCEFREELHRSRDQIAKSHPNLDEIENSVRTTLAIDRTQRSFSPSRNSTATAPIPTTTATNIITNNISTTTSSSNGGGGVSYNSNISKSTTAVATTKEKANGAPVKTVTEIIKEEWESVVLKAKEKFSRSSYNQQLLQLQVPSNNNGKSGDPFHSEATLLLESDLDTGGVQEYPGADNLISYGDALRLRDLGKVLKVEDFTTTASVVPKNSCSLQNLSLCGVSPKMATLKPGDPGGGANGGKEDRSRSMEFLIDESNKNAHLLPPENTLMKNQDTRRMSEHELRIQRSLQKLNVPDWYKNYAPSGTVSAAVTPNKTRDFGSGTGLAGGWPGLSTSKTNSLTSLQSAGRYAGSKSGFGYGKHRNTGTASTGGRSSRESLMSPSSTASASPSPNFERSSFTYGMPYALTRFAAARMSCGASPASLSPSPSPVGGIGTSTSTPVSSGPTARYGYQKTPYLGWRSQERLNQKSLYRSPAERLAADLIAQKVKPPVPIPVVVEQPPPPEIEIKTSPKKEIASSDLSLNNSEESNSHKLNRVRSSIKEVSNAIVDYVNETKPLDDGMNGRASPRRGLVWLESSFVGTKPIDSPGTPDTPSTFISQRGTRKDTAFRFDEASADRHKDSDVKSGESSSTSHYTSYISRNEQMEERSNSSSVSSPTLEDILDSLLALRRPNKKFRSRGKGHESTSTKVASCGDTVGEKLEDSNTPTPTLLPTTTTTTTITSSNESFRTHQASSATGTTTYQQYQYEPSTTSEIYSTSTRQINKYGYQSQSASSTTKGTSDWQERMNQPPTDSTFLSGESETFTLIGERVKGTTGASSVPSSTLVISSSSYNSDSQNNASSINEGQQLLNRYSSASVSNTTGGSDQYKADYGGSYTTHSASSSVHSTPTHQPYQYKQQQQNNQSTVVASSKDYYHSSTSSSPAKSCLIDSTQRDDNELRQSVLRGPVPGEEDEELAFGNPTEIRSTVTTSTVAPITGGVIVNPLTGLSEYSNPPTPARNRRVSFDLDFSDKEEKSSSRSRNKDENVGGTIQCRNTKCGKTATGLEARREFKVCHNCNAYYCSRECRRSHWEKHKKTCMQSRVGAICKQIISHVKEDSYVMNQLSTTAKRGFLAKGRGCVKLFYNSPDRADRFLTGGLPELPEPLYIPVSDMLPEEMGAQTFSELSEQCRSYNPETRFVLYTCVCVVNEVPTYGAVKWERELISRSSKLRLLLPRNFYEENQRHHHAPANPAHLMPTLQDTTNNDRTSPAAPPSGLQQSQQSHVPLYDSVAPANTGGADDFLPPPLPPHQNTTITSTNTTSSSDNDTLILRSVPPPSSHQLSSNEHKRLREVSFTNIQKHLLLRGVDLKRSYPDIYTKLCRYVEHDEPFLPVTIYPKNTQTGRQFVCVIMPESSDSAYNAATEESGQRHPLQRVETINISEQDDDEFLDIT